MIERSAMSYIVLKFDDLTEKNIDIFRVVWKYCSDKNIPVSFGLIGNSLYHNLSSEYIMLLKAMKREGIELWNHGFIHSVGEFSESTYNQQHDSIRSTQLLMKEYLGESAITFGSPHNNSTETTVKVLRDEFPEIENYYFMVDAGGVSGARQLVMRCNYEIETGVVDLDFFHKEYERIKKYPYFVMQGHPSFWREEDFGRFKKILDILIEDKNKFVTSEELSKIDISGFHQMFSDVWSNDILEFTAGYDKTVLYGAGEIGREIYRFLRMKGIKPDAFVVSDGHKTFTEICGTPVYSMTEVKKYMHEFAVIPALLEKNHRSIFRAKEFEDVSIWKPQNGTYNEFIDYIRYVVSVDSWK